MDKILRPDITDKEVSDIIYRGVWAELELLKKNPKFIGYDETVWPYMAKDREFFWTPWFPVIFVFTLMFINLYFRMYQQFYSAIMAGISLIYITYIVPLLNKEKEKIRIQFIDEVLLDSPYHRSEHVEVNAMIEKFLNSSAEQVATEPEVLPEAPLKEEPQDPTKT